MNPLVLYFLFINCLFLPYMAIRGYLRMKSAEPREISRKKIYLSSAITLLMLTGFALFVAQDVGMILFRPWNPGPAEMAIGLILLFGWFLLREKLLPWLKRGAPANNVLRMPTTWRQLAGWAVVSLVAGVGEEIIYRGVLFNSVLWWINLPIVAALISAAVFGIVHIAQGYRSVLFISVLALSFQGLVWFAGSLYMAVVAHATFDFAVGLRYVLAKQRSDAAAATA